MDAITIHTGTAVPLRRSNVDTDQIIPAVYLKRITKTGFEYGLFRSWRDNDPAFVLNDDRFAGASVLVAGAEFGTGSSREHAVWALRDYGFRAVIAPSFGDIFRNNALKNGLLPIVVEPALHKRLLAEPGTEVTISLEDQTLRLGDGTTAQFTVEPFARYCLLNGVDELAFLQSADADIARFEARPAY